MPPPGVCDCGGTQPPRRTRPPGSEAMCERVKTKFSDEDPTSVSEAATAAVAASAVDLEKGNCPKWRPEEVFGPQVALEVINSWKALSGAGCDGLCAFRSYRKSLVWLGKFGAGIETFSRPLIDDPSVFPPEFWQLFLQSNLTALGEKFRPVWVGMTWRRHLAAGTTRQWRSGLEEINRETRQAGLGVRGGVQQVELRA